MDPIPTKVRHRLHRRDPYLTMIYYICVQKCKGGACCSKTPAKSSVEGAPAVGPEMTDKKNAIMESKVCVLAHSHCILMANRVAVTSHAVRKILSILRRKQYSRRADRRTLPLPTTLRRLSQLLLACSADVLVGSNNRRPTCGARHDRGSRFFSFFFCYNQTINDTGFVLGVYEALL